MVEQVLVQQLTDDHNNYCWGVVNDKGQWREKPRAGDRAALLASLQLIGLPIVLAIPGEKVVMNRVAYSPAEKRHFRQLVPYQLEEQIIGKVEDLHFVVGSLTMDDAIVAYVDDNWFVETVTWYSDHDFTIKRCVVDFQLLQPAANQWIIWSTESRVLCCHSSGLGFATHCNLLQPLLADVFSEKAGPGTDIQLYSYSKQVLQHLFECLPDTVRDHATRNISEPELDLLGNNGVDFCQGPYARKLPFGHWWRSLRTTVILAAAVLLAFISVNLLEVFQLKDRQRLVKQHIEQRYRQVVPQGAMVDAVKQLQRKLGTTDTVASESQVLYLLSVVGPAIKEQGIGITTLTYHDNNKELRLNIEAKSFSGIEKLRKQLQAKNLNAQLKRSDSGEDSVRANLHISVAEG